jgi:hypothetical protein
MKQLSDYTGKKIIFNQPSVFKRIYELRAGDELIGTIQQKGFFGMRWEVSLLNKSWEIYRPSIWRSTLEIREGGYEMPIADFAKEGFRSRGVVTLPMGERLKIAPHLFRGFTEISNEQDECLVRIKSSASLKEKAEVHIEKRSEAVDKYPWIIILAYIIAVEQKHQAAHAG